jgi:hypothetical protein
MKREVVKQNEVGTQRVLSVSLQLEKEDTMLKLARILPIVIITFFIVISLTLAPSAEAGKLSGKSVKIGGIYSVSGVCAEWGTAAKISAEIAVEEINAAGGIGGVPIEMVWYDVGCKAPRPNRIRFWWSMGPARVRFARLSSRSLTASRCRWFLFAHLNRGFRP